MSHTDYSWFNPWGKEEKHYIHLYFIDLTYNFIIFVSFLLHFTVKIIKKKILKIRLTILLFYYLFFLLLLITLSLPSFPPFLCFSLPAFLLSVSLLSFYSCICNIMFSYRAFESIWLTLLSSLSYLFILYYSFLRIWTCWQT